MKLIKKILLAILIVLVAIQFIQPGKNNSNEILPTDISKQFSIPESVQAVLKTSCYDCHSNNTRYPWYSFIQPGAWWMASHIKNGKADLNFSEFGSYSTHKQQSKLKSIANTINDGSMPLSAYTIIHNTAKLSKENKALVIDWATKMKDSLSQKIKL
ncbi:MAG: heme-binding domain-containing protein [Chitinophagaceae bacterium]|nr:heme-binding domain-containing protein [Chitinophagaceae bacterium]